MGEHYLHHHENRRACMIQISKSARCRIAKALTWQKFLEFCVLKSCVSQGLCIWTSALSKSQQTVLHEEMFSGDQQYETEETQKLK